jgi:hypothetical protein
VRSLHEVLCNVSQVFDGWHNDGTAWSEWDESVRKDVSEWQRYIDGKTVSVVAAAHSAQVEAERDKWRIAMENLTPGGSEFHKDLDRCVAHIRERFDTEHRWMLKAVADKKAAEAELVKLRAALRQIMHDGLNHVNNEWHCGKLAQEALGETVPEEKQ